MSEDYKNIIEIEHNNFKLEVTNNVLNINKKTNLKLILHDIIEVNADPISIDFHPLTNEQKTTFLNKLFEEVILRYLSFIGKSLENLRSSI